MFTSCDRAYLPQGPRLSGLLQKDAAYNARKKNQAKLNAAFHRFSAPWVMRPEEDAEGFAASCS